MGEVTAGAALHLRVAAMGLQRAGADLASTVERLCEHDLPDHERAASTKRLHAALADVRLALTKLGEAEDAGEADAVDPEVVLTVARGRWRQHGWDRTPRAW